MYYLQRVGVELNVAFYISLHALCGVANQLVYFKNVTFVNRGCYKNAFKIVALDTLQLANFSHAGLLSTL